MGYDIERFVGYVNEGLLCSICRDVLEDPLQAPCEHAFCTACIHGWLVHHSNCPEDRQMIDVSLLRPLYRYTIILLYVEITLIYDFSTLLAWLHLLSFTVTQIVFIQYAYGKTNRLHESISIFCLL